MCRCGLSCDYTIEALEYSGREKEGCGVPVGLFIPEEEIIKSEDSFKPP